MTQLGTFAEYAVLAEESVIKIDDSIPLEAASLVSCGVTTGWGSGTVGVGTQPGDTVVIIGTGGVGINAVQGARAAGAKTVIAVDPVDFKRDTAKFFGATETGRRRRGHPAGAGADQRGDGGPGSADAQRASRGHAGPGHDADPQRRHLPDDRRSEVRSRTIVPLILVDFMQSCKTLKGLIYGGMNPRASMPMLLSCTATATSNSTS